MAGTAAVSDRLPGLYHRAEVAPAADTWVPPGSGEATHDGLDLAARGLAWRAAGIAVRSTTTVYVDHPVGNAERRLVLGSYDYHLGQPVTVIYDPADSGHVRTVEDETGGHFEPRLPAARAEPPAAGVGRW